MVNIITNYLGVSMVDMDNFTKDQFFSWLSGEVTISYASELLCLLNEIDRDCQENKIIDKSIFDEATDLNTIKTVKRTIKRNPLFRFGKKRKISNMDKALQYYYRFIQEIQNGNIDDKFTEDIIFSEAQGSCKSEISSEEDNISDYIEKNKRKDEFYIWLKKNQRMSEIDRRKYVSSIKNIDKFSKKNKITVQELYGLEDIHTVKNIADLLSKNNYFIEFDKKQNNLFSKALIKYIEFLNNKSKNIDNRIEIEQKDEVVLMIEDKNMKYIDNREKNGCLWIINNEESSLFVEDCINKGFDFHFCKNGGRATGGKPAWWTKDNINLNDDHNFDTKYFEEILIEFFQKGFRIKSGLDMKRFRRYLSDKFNFEITIDDKEIRSIISRIGIPYQDFVYISRVMIDEDSRKKLVEYIDNSFNDGKKAIYYEAIFKEMNVVLQGQRIYNAEMLKIYLSHELGQKYHIDKNYITLEKNINIDPYEEVKICMKSEGIPMKFEDVFNRLSHIPENKIISIIRSNKEFVCNKSKEYFHVDIIDLSSYEIQLISRIIRQSITEKEFIIGEELIENINLKYPEIAERYSMVSKIGMRDAIAYKLNREFSFTGKIISELDKNISMYKVFSEFCKSRAYFKLEDLNSLKKSLDTTIYFDAVYENSLRISEEDFVPIELAQFDVERTDKSIERFISGEYVSLKDISQFGSFPEAGFPWNQYILEHYVSSFSKSYKLINNGYSANVCVGGIVKKESKIDNLNDLLVDVLASSTINLSSDESIQYLYDRGFIGRRRLGDIDQIIFNAKTIRTQKG